MSPQDADFYDMIIEFGAILVMYYHPSCPRSRSFMREFESAARTLIMYQPHISTGKVRLTSWRYSRTKKETNFYFILFYEYIDKK